MKIYLMVKHISSQLRKGVGFLVLALISVEYLFIPFVFARVSTISSRSLRQFSPAAVTVCRSGLDLANAFSNSSISIAELELDIALTDTDFQGLRLPIVLKRNFTVQSARDRMITLDFNFVSNKIRLSEGVTLAFRNLLTLNVRAKTFGLTPGVDLLVSNRPNEKAIVLIEGGVHVQEICFSQPRKLDGYKARPAELPGKQTSLPLSTRQEGCVNDTGAPLLARCWPARGGWVDVALHAYDLIPAESYDLNNFVDYMLLTNYYLWLRSAEYLCARVLDEDCMQTLGVIGCVWHYAKDLRPFKPQFVPSPTARTSASADAADYLDLEAPPPNMGSPATTGSSQRHARVVIGVVLGIVGGVVLVALVVGALLRRTAARRAGLPTERDKRSSSGSGTAGFGGNIWCAVVNRHHQGEGSPRVIAIIDAATSDSKAPTSGTMPISTRQCGGHFVDGPSVVVSPLTPRRADLNLNVRLADDEMTGDKQLASESRSNAADRAGAKYGHVSDGGGARDGGSTAGDTPSKCSTGCAPEELRLLGTVLGRGTSGKVVLGEYQGRKVAVKIMDFGVRDATHLETALWKHPAQVHEDRQQQDHSQQQHQIPAREKQEQQQGIQHGSQSSSVAQPVTCDIFDPQTCHNELGALLKAFRQEIEVLGRCRHPNVVRLLAACITPPRLCLVMELAETNLARMLYGASGEKGQLPPQSDDRLLPLPTVLMIATDIARGLEYLHPTIMHRDLKPANVLIHGARTERPCAKLADFGVSRICTTMHVTLYPEVGTPSYMAPECFDPDNFVVTHRADIYSLAIVMYEMLSGEQPWPKASITEIAFNVTLHGNRPPLDMVSIDRCPRKLQKLIVQCWDQDPKRRPAAAEVVKQLLLIQEQMHHRTPSDIKGEDGPTSDSCSGGPLPLQP